MRRGGSADDALGDLETLRYVHPEGPPLHAAAILDGRNKVLKGDITDQELLDLPASRFEGTLRNRCMLLRTCRPACSRFGRGRRIDCGVIIVVVVVVVVVVVGGGGDDVDDVVVVVVVVVVGCCCCCCCCCWRW